MPALPACGGADSSGNAGEARAENDGEHSAGSTGVEIASGEAPASPLEIPTEDLSLAAQIEALLFVAPDGVAVSQLASALEVPAPAIEGGLADLERILGSRGIRLQWFKDRVQLTSAPQMAARIERFLGLENTTHLTRAALETLAIIAYRQPVTRPQLEAVRGVNSDSVLRSLMSKGLIEEIGRSEGPGRPVLYGTTPEFLQHFGIGSLKELPALDLGSPASDNGARPPPGNGHVLKE